jgi:predicted amidohydrolase YtcJ
LVGRAADFIVLGDDPFEVPASRLRAVRVDATFVGGTLVSRRKGTG